jgi:predicted HTH domain antitoxin
MLTDIKLDLPLGISEEDAKLFLAIKLYELGKVSLGKAAEISGFSKVAFLEILGRYQVPVFAYSPEELRQEVEG